MPTRNPRKKGDALEDAVHAIETAILQQAPGYATGTFKIQGKRIFNAAGVQHEVDIFVTASLPAGYDATFAFECKNWSSKVGKNELIVFSEKISAIGAHRGFFVAAAFTKDAKAQAAKDPRIQLLTANHFEPVTRVVFPQFHMRHIGATSVQVTIRGFGRKRNTRTVNLAGHILSIRGATQPIEGYVQTLIAEFRETHVNQLSTDKLNEGCQSVTFEGEVNFSKGEAFLDDKPIQSIRIQGTTELSVALASVLSVYEVQTRGRLIVIGASAGGIEMRAEVVEVNEAPK